MNHTSHPTSHLQVHSEQIQPIDEDVRDYTTNPITKSNVQKCTPFEMESIVASTTNKVDSCTTIATATCLYTTILLCSMFVFLAFDIYLTSTNKAVTTRLTQIPNLQLLFFVFVIFSPAAVLIQSSFHTPQHDAKSSFPMAPLPFPVRLKVKQQQKQQRALGALIFLSGLITILVLTVSSITTRDGNWKNVPVNRKNCTAATILVTNDLKTCTEVPSTVGNFFKLASNLPQLDLGENSDRDQQVIKVFKEIDALTSYIDFFVRIEEELDRYGEEEKQSVMNTVKMLFSNKDCAWTVIDYMCALMVTPCSHQSCDTIPLNCTDIWFDKWIECGQKKCSEHPTCSLESDVTVEKVSRVMEYVNKFVSQGDTYNELMKSSNRNKGELLIFCFNQMKSLANRRFAGETAATNNQKVACQWRQDSPKQNADTDSIYNCNPKITQGEKQGDRYNDGTLVLLSAFAIGFILLGYSGYQQHIGLTMLDPVTIISILLGLFICGVMFVGGVNVERASLVDDNVELKMFSSLYYIVSWMCYYHTISLINPKKKKKKKHSKIKCKFFKKHWLYQELWLKTGEYFLLRFYIFELFEVGFQLFGVQNSKDETEASSVFLTTFIVGLNLLVVPLVLEISLYLSGPTMATLVSVLC